MAARESLKYYAFNAPGPRKKFSSGYFIMPTGEARMTATTSREDTAHLASNVSVDMMLFAALEESFVCFGDKREGRQRAFSVGWLQTTA
jgi:hypothetical protein